MPENPNYNLDPPPEPVGNQCSYCACYYANWDDEVEDTMDDQAPGEECSNGERPDKWRFHNERCPAFCVMY